MAYGWRNSCRSRLCNFLQFGDATFSKNILHFSPKSACKKQFEELKAGKEELSLKELVSYPWISLTAETITRRFLNEYFEKNGLTFAPDMELATTDMILPAVRHNLGLGFIPAEFADAELKSGQVFEIKVKEKLPERNIILIYDMEYPQSIAAKEFQKFLKEKGN